MPDKRKCSNVEKPNDDSKKRPSRQDPVSCESCRRKKLKCDRNQPCSSCQSRKIPCNYAISNAARQFTHPPVALPTPVTDSPMPTSNNVASISHVYHPQGISLPSQGTADSRATTDWLENIVMAPRLPDALPISIKNKLTATKHTAVSVTNLTSFLPRETEAFAQFNYYVNYVDFLYHTIIPSQFEAQIHAIYRSVHDASSPAVNLNHLALLFSILATAYYFQNLGTNIASVKQVEKRCHEYITLITEALTQSDYMNYPTVEGLQAALVVIQFLPNHGQGTTSRALFNTGALVNQCRQMGLFQIDSAQNKRLRIAHGFDPVDVELKRRLAWLVASSDWFLAYLGGPQEGSYLVNPAHIALDMPSNLPDDDLCALEVGNSDSLPENVPTTMSYFICRVKLSIYCRDIVDATCGERLNGLEVPYDKIIELDQKLHQFNQDLPEFFRYDNDSRRKYAQVYADSPHIAWQRLLILQGSYSRLCRLHRPYLIRGAKDPAYSYSYMVCLRAARRVIEIKRIMDREFPDTPSLTTTWSVMHHVFMAAVILLTDTCFNWDDILAERRKEEILEACRMLDKARRSSRLVREGINAMMDVLQNSWRSAASDLLPPLQQSEHSIQYQEPKDPLTAWEVDQSCARGVENISASTDVYPSTVAENNSTSVVDAVDDVYLENIWSELIESGSVVARNPNEWMGLFSDLTESAPVL